MPEIGGKDWVGIGFTTAQSHEGVGDKTHNCSIPKRVGKRNHNCSISPRDGKNDSQLLNPTKGWGKRLTTAQSQ